MEDSSDHRLAARLGGHDQLQQRRRRQAIDTSDLRVFSAKRPLDFLAKQHRLIRFALGCCGLWGRGRRNAAALQRVDHTFHLPGLPPAFEGFRILQLADMHFECDLGLTDVLVEAIRDLEYDFVVCTGDFRFGTQGAHAISIRETARLMEVIKTPMATVLGNHDPVEMVPELEALGDLTVLLNEALPIERDGQTLYLLGIDDPHHHETHDLERALARVPADSFTLLLAHSAEVYAEAEALGIRALLCGHTHGGQLCLPGGWSLNHADAPRRFLRGAWHHGRLQGYTSRGSGCTGLPVRFNCPPELTLHRLTGQTPSG